MKNSEILYRLAALVAAIGIFFSGCGGRENTKLVITTGFAKDEIFRIEEMSCNKAEMMIYLTNIQNHYETVYGTKIWETNIEGTTLEENVKETALAKMAQIKAMTLLAKEHEVELTDVGKVAAAAGGADDVLFLDVVHHLIVGPAGGVVLQTVLERVVLDELVGSVAGAADLAVHEGIREAAQVTRSDPGLGVHDDCGVQTHVVAALLHELLPPSLLDVVLELNAQGAVVPRVGETAVDLGAGEDEAAVLTQRDDLVHSLCGIIHDLYTSLTVFNGNKIK